MKNDLENLCKKHIENQILFDYALHKLSGGYVNVKINSIELDEERPNVVTIGYYYDYGVYGEYEHKISEEQTINLMVNLEEVDKDESTDSN